MRKHKRHVIGVVTVAVAALLLTPIGVKLAQAKPVFAEHMMVPVDEWWQMPNPVPTPYGPILLSGYMHYRFIVNADENGHFHIVSHVNPTAVTGVNLITGDTYHAGGAFHYHQYRVPGPGGEINVTIASPMFLISKGNAPNYMEFVLIHLTKNAKGEITVEFEKAH